MCKYCDRINAAQQNGDATEIGTQLGKALGRFFEGIEKTASTQTVLSAAHKAFRKHVNTDRFDYMAHTETTYSRHGVNTELGIAITWQHPDGGQVSLLYGEDLTSTDEVDSLINTWKILQAELSDDDKVRAYLVTVPFDKRTIAGANQYLISQGDAA